MTIEVHTAKWNIKQLKTMNGNDTIRFDYPIQRAGDQWNQEQKSLLIDSILNGYPIPPLYFLRFYEEREGAAKPVAVREVLDGKQRLTSVFDFLDDKWALKEGLKVVTLDGIDYESSGKFFSELDETLQNTILGYGFPTYTMDDILVTDEEIEELFYRMNNSTALSPQQKAKSLIGIKFSRLMDDVKKHEIFDGISGFTGNQIKKDVHQGAIMQAMMMLENYPFAKFTPSIVADYAKTFKNDFDNKVQSLEKIESAFDYLCEAFTTKQNFLLKAINFPMTINLALYALEKEIDSSVFGMWGTAFTDAIKGVETNDKTNYLDFTGAGSTDKSKIEGRMNEMLRHFKNYVELWSVKN